MLALSAGGLAPLPKPKEILDPAVYSLLAIAWKQFSVSLQFSNIEDFPAYYAYKNIETQYIPIYCVLMYCSIHFVTIQVLNGLSMFFRNSVSTHNLVLR